MDINSHGTIKAPGLAIVIAPLKFWIQQAPWVKGFHHVTRIFNPLADEVAGQASAAASTYIARPHDSMLIIVPRQHECADHHLLARFNLVKNLCEKHIGQLREALSGKVCAETHHALLTALAIGLSLAYSVSGHKELIDSINCFVESLAPRLPHFITICSLTSSEWNANIDGALLRAHISHAQTAERINLYHAQLSVCAAIKGIDPTLPNIQWPWCVFRTPFTPKLHFLPLGAPHTPAHGPPFILAQLATHLPGATGIHVGGIVLQLLLSIMQIAAPEGKIIRSIYLTNIHSFVGTRSYSM